MLKIGKTEAHIEKLLKKRKAIHMTLIDPSEYENGSLKSIVSECIDAGTDAFIIRPALSTYPLLIANAAKAIKELSSEIPVILLPTNVEDLTGGVDAVLFTTLLNSRNTYWLAGAQALGAPVIKQSGIEAIPTAYLVVAPGGTASWMGDVKPIPKDGDELAAIHALGGEYFGMRYLYLETGAGCSDNVRPEMVERIAQDSDIIVMVECSDSSGQYVKSLVSAGAKIIVTRYHKGVEKEVSAVKC